MRRTNGKTLTYSADFAVAADGVKSFNARCERGSLVAENSLQLQQNAYAYFPCGNFSLIFNDSGVYSVCGNVRKRVGEVVAAAPAFLFVQPLQLAVISCEDGTFTCDGGEFEKISDIHFCKMAFSHERIFGVSDGVLYFTARDDFSTWKTVNLANVSSVCVMQDVFAVGNDVVKVDFSDSEVDAKILPLFRGVGAVQARSVAVWGNKIFFVTANELKRYSYNRCKTLSSNFTFENAFGAVVGGTYYVTATCGDKKCVVCLDCETEKITGVLPLSAYCISGDDLPYFGTESGVYAFGEGFSDLFWQSPSVHFGVSGKKYLRKLVVDTVFPLEVHVVTDRECKIYRFDGAPYVQSIGINGWFGKMRLKLLGQGQAKINKVAVTCQTYGEGVVL